MADKPKSHILVRHVAPLVPAALAVAAHVATPTTPGLATLTTQSITATKCEETADFHACHANYPTGCSPSGKYDAYLNYLKNQLIPPPAATTSLQFLSQADFRSLDSNTPQQLGGHANNHGQFKDQLAKLGEGKVFGLLGYLYHAKLSGAESSNCELSATDKEGSNVDYHIYVGFDPALATKLRNKQSLSPEEKKQITQTSIIVEMTPHDRAAYEQGTWDITTLEGLYGTQVRVSGQLMADSEHNVSGQNCALGLTPTCWRASIWELHPVTGFQLCKDPSNNCAPGSSSWAQLGP